MDFVDTSAWFAYFVPTDPNHQRVRSCLRFNGGPLITTDYCIDETLTFLLYRRELRRALDAGRAFFEENIARLHFVTSKQINQAWIVFQQKAAAGWSFTDCTSKIVIDEMGIVTAVTLDAHFQQLGIVVLP
jgi:predicted nucleic acid-binding protein